MTKSEDFIPLLAAPEQNLGYRQGVVVTWNLDDGTNQVRVGDAVLLNLSVITQSDLINIRPGDTVAIIKYNDSYAVLGKIKSGGSPGTPWIPVPLYPQFNSLTGFGGTGFWSVNVGTLAVWQGHTYATHHSAIEVDGIWGQVSGSNTVTFEVHVAGVMVGTWTTVTTLDVGRKGPYSIANFKDQEFVSVQVKITSSVGSGTVAIQVLGCHLRQP